VVPENQNAVDHPGVVHRFFVTELE
jgi:hypothetical protein